MSIVIDGREYMVRDGFVYWRDDPLSPPQPLMDGYGGHKKCPDGELERILDEMYDPDESPVDKRRQLVIRRMDLMEAGMRAAPGNDRMEAQQALSNFDAWHPGILRYMERGLAQVVIRPLCDRYWEYAECCSGITEYKNGRWWCKNHSLK
jgi:hypothetical protein